MAKDSMLSGMGNLSPDAAKMSDAKSRVSMKDLAALLRFTGTSKFSIVLLILAAILSGGLQVVAPAFLGATIDNMGEAGNVDLQYLGTRALILLGMYLVAAVFTWVVSYFANVVAAKTALEVRKALSKKLTRLPVSFYDTHPQGDTATHFINDADAISEGMLQGLLNFFTVMVTILGTVGFMVFISWKMTLIILPMAFLMIWSATTIAKTTTKYFKSQQNLVGSISGDVEENLYGRKEIKAFGCEDKFLDSFREKNDRLNKSSVTAQFASSLPNPVTRFVDSTTYILIGALGVWFGGLTAGNITTFILYWKNFSKPINDLTNITTQVMAAFASLSRVFKILDLPEESEDPTTDEKSASSEKATSELNEKHSGEGEVLFEHVTFGYTSDKKIFDDFSLRVEPGQKVAIIGPTGCGKTTLMNLLMRFYEADGGRILIDGKDIREIPRSELRRRFGMVLQETWLLERSIRENIAYGRPDATDEEVIAAAKAARAHGFIKRLPDGYDTIPGKEISLSEGQKQLLCIARVLLMDPDLLILDEATSAVDTLTEKRIVEAFDNMTRGRTGFIIAHRLSTIAGADQVISLGAAKTK
ncbi:MAG: ABC transporter ATP-binding protein [Clostridiales bacterium]|nr:ABC transporter ATP-binding protein [Clostridiales bacterium]MBR5057514.1 ABC transporter ATP-binding protein [Clostridiales bacterium]